MGVIVRLLTFLVGAAGLIFTGLDTMQEHFGAPVGDWLAMMGETPAGIANNLLAMVGGGIDSLGGMLAGMQGGEVDPNAEPGLVQTWAPEAITALVSILLVMFATRQ